MPPLELETHENLKTAASIAYPVLSSIDVLRFPVIAISCLYPFGWFSVATSNYWHINLLVSLATSSPQLLSTFFLLQVVVGGVSVKVSGACVAVSIVFIGTVNLYVIQHYRPGEFLPGFALLTTLAELSC